MPRDHPRRPPHMSPPHRRIRLAHLPAHPVGAHRADPDAEICSDVRRRQPLSVRARRWSRHGTIVP